MKTAKLTIKRLPLAKLLPHPKNPRKHPEPGTPAWDTLKKSLEADYFDAITINSGKKDPSLRNVMVSGHLRSKVLLESGFTEADCVIVDYDAPTHEARLLAANNHLGVDDNEAVEAILRGLSDGETDMALTGLDEKEISSWLAAPEEPVEKLMEITDELPGAHALKADMTFPSDQVYGIPSFRPEMLANCPEDISTWAGRDVTDEAPHYFYNLSTDSVKGLDFAKTIIGFYTDDARFESAWTDADIFTSKLLNRNPLAVLSPNYSLWFDMPKAIKIYNTYRSRWVGRYFQEAGLKVIPDVNFSDPDSFEFCMAGIPGGAPCLAIQIQTGKKTAEEVSAKRDALRHIITACYPESVLLYCGTDYEEITKDVFEKTKVIVLKSRLLKRREAMTKASKVVKTR